MAVHTRHPVGAPPTAPVRESTGHLLLRGYTILLLFIALATTFWYNLIGPVGLAILLAATTVTSVVLWLVVRPFVMWRRLPWIAFAYIAWAGASVLWTHWLDATLITWGVLVCTTLQGLFVASVLTWRELVRAIASALKWVMGLSIALELWVAVVLVHPILPNFFEWSGKITPELYWVRENLFYDGRIQGIVGNAHLLAIASLLAIVVFGIRIASGAPRRTLLYLWIALSAFLLIRSGSGTVWLALAALALVLTTMLLMRTTKHPGERTKYYIAYAVIGTGLAVVVWFLRDEVLGLLGKSGDLTGRGGIWASVLERAAEHPVIGWGFTTPWLPWEPAFEDWIIVKTVAVFHAHNMWIDVLFQVGWIGVALMILTYLAFVWRSWFFAVDRPRWDLTPDREYQALTLLPSLVATILLVQGLAESRPLMEWGWMFLIMFAFKIKQSPFVGVGPAEQSLAIERGELLGQGSR